MATVNEVLKKLKKTAGIYTAMEQTMINTGIPRKMVKYQFPGMAVVNWPKERKIVFLKLLG